MNPTVLLFSLLSGSVPTDDTSIEGPPDIRGTWRFDLRIHSNARVPVLGTTHVTALTTFLAEVSGSPEQPQVHAVACHLHAEPDRALARTIIPESFVAAIPERRFPATLTPTADGWSFHADMAPQYLGYNPKIAGEKPPHDSDSAGVEDLEGDGHPGGTIHLDAPILGLVDLYVVQRAHTVLKGYWQSPDVIEGKADVLAFGQRTIGASNPLFLANADITVAGSLSSFRWTRVSPGTTCAQLRAGRI